MVCWTECNPFTCFSDDYECVSVITITCNMNDSKRIQKFSDKLYKYDVFTAPHGDSPTLHSHHRGETFAQAAQLLWIRTDRSWCVISWMSFLIYVWFRDLPETLFYWTQSWRSWMKTSTRSQTRMWDLPNVTTLRTWRSASLRSNWVSSPLTSCHLISRWPHTFIILFYSPFHFLCGAS